MTRCILRIDGRKVMAGIDRAIPEAGQYLLTYTASIRGPGRIMAVADKNAAKVFHTPEVARAMQENLTTLATTILPKE